MTIANEHVRFAGVVDAARATINELTAHVNGFILQFTNMTTELLETHASKLKQHSEQIARLSGPQSLRMRGTLN